MNTPDDRIGNIMAGVLLGTFAIAFLVIYINAGMAAFSEEIKNVTHISIPSLFLLVGLTVGFFSANIELLFGSLFYSVVSFIILEKLNDGLVGILLVVGLSALYYWGLWLSTERTNSSLGDGIRDKND